MAETFTDHQKKSPNAPPHFYAPYNEEQPSNLFLPVGYAKFCVSGQRIEQHVWIFHVSLPFVW